MKPLLARIALYAIGAVWCWGAMHVGPVLAALMILAACATWALALSPLMKDDLDE